MDQEFHPPRCLTRIAWLGLFVLAGCSRDHSHATDHHHSEEPKTAQITVWGERHELFIEHRFVVAGTPTKFVTHVTDLTTLEPRRQGPIKFVLSQENERPIEQVDQAPARPGIYEASLSFPKAGQWQISVSIPTEAGDSVMPLPRLTVFATKHDADHADEPEAPEGVSFLKEQQWKILSKAEPATKRTLVARMRLPAAIRAKPGFSATMVAPLSGQLVALPGQPLAQPGQRVQAGQLLALLTPNFSEAAARVAEANAEFSTAKAALEQTEAAYTRTKKLVAEQARSPRELEEAELGWQSAKARFGAAASLLATFKEAGGVGLADAPLMMELRVPIAGVLNSVAAGPGDVVAAGQPVFSVLNPETVWIEAHAPEASVSLLSGTRKAAVELGGQFIPITGEDRGEFLALGLEIDAATRTVPLLYEARNEEGQFRVGQRVAVHVETTRAEDAVAVPEGALVEEGEQLVAFVQVSGETFSKRVVKTGIREQGFVQIIEGISEGERVVTKGAYAIRLSSISGAIPAHGHVH